MERMFRAIGAKLIRFLTQTYQMSIYAGRTVAQLRNAYFYRKQIVDQCYEIGVGSFPLVCLVSAFSGMAVSIQMAYQMEVYVPDYMVGSIVVRSIVLELAPILMGLVLAGRVGAGIASEVGTMKVSEQVDALTAMAVDPVGYLMMPRVVAGLIMIPVLVSYSCLLSIGCGFLMSIVKMDISVYNFIKGMKLDFMPYDVVVGMTKSVVYGGAITFIGSYVGLNAEGGAQGVGRAATKAVVISSALVLILDYFLTHTMLT